MRTLTTVSVHPLPYRVFRFSILIQIAMIVRHKTSAWDFASPLAYGLSCSRLVAAHRRVRGPALKSLDRNDRLHSYGITRLQILYARRRPSPRPVTNVESRRVLLYK